MSFAQIPFKPGMKVGLGYDRLTGNVLTSPAVQAESTSAPANATGQQVLSDCITINDVESLHRALGLSIDAGGSYMGFSGNVKAQYISSCNFSSYSTYVMVRVSVMNAADTLDDPVYTNDARALIVNNRADRFRQRFGDAFISGINRGGEFFAIYQVTGLEASERQDLSVKIRASFGGVIGSAHLNSDINEAIRKSSSHLEVQVHVFRQGTIRMADLTIEDIMATAKAFPIEVAGDRAYAYTVLLSDYKELELPSDDFTFEEITRQQDVLRDLAAKRFEFLRRKADIAYAIEHPGDFQDDDGAVDVGRLRQRLNDIGRAIDTMQHEASACSQRVGNCNFTDFDIGDFPAPTLKAGHAPRPEPQEAPSFLYGGPVRQPGTAQCFIVERGVARALDAPTWQSLYGGDPLKVPESEQLGTLPRGAPVMSGARLVQVRNEPPVFLQEGPDRRPIASNEVFSDFGFKKRMIKHFDTIDDLDEETRPSKDAVTASPIDKRIH